MENAQKWEGLKSGQEKKSDEAVSGSGLRAVKDGENGGIPPLLGNRRDLSRICVNVPVVLGVVFPQDSFTPLFEETSVWNLSVDGALATVTMPDSILRKSLTEPHYCRLQFMVDGLPSRVIARIAWLRRDDSQRQWTHTIGLRFLEMSDRDLERLERFVGTMRSNSQRQNVIATVAEDCA